MSVTSEKAGTALGAIGNILLEGKVLTPEGFAVLSALARGLKLKRDATAWEVFVGRDQPITFEDLMDDESNIIAPSIIADIKVEQTDQSTIPFRTLDIAIEIAPKEAQGQFTRWHLDLANRSSDSWQSGPLFHLQYGGHIRNQRHLDSALKVPRWCHPPMELALLCEVVTANFYEAEWLKLRENPVWCSSICLFQKLCYSSYLDKINSCMAVSSSTALNAMWASDWGEKAFRK